MIKCPECKEKITDTNWFYTRNLFGDTDAQKEECPHCEKDFMIIGYQMVDWKVSTVQDYEEIGDII